MSKMPARWNGPSTAPASPPASTASSVFTCSARLPCCWAFAMHMACRRSEEHTSELQSPCNLVCRLLLEKKKLTTTIRTRGLVLTEHEFSVPLDHSRPDDDRITVFAREVADPDGLQRPYLVFLQGGPGNE